MRGPLLVEDLQLLAAHLLRQIAASSNRPDLVAEVDADLGERLRERRARPSDRATAPAQPPVEHRDSDAPDARIAPDDAVTAALGLRVVLRAVARSRTRAVREIRPAHDAVARRRRRPIRHDTHPEPRSRRSGPG